MAITSVQQLFSVLGEGKYDEARAYVHAQLQQDPTSPLYNGVKVYIGYLAEDLEEIEQSSTKALQHINKQTLRTFLIQAFLQYNLNSQSNEAFEHVNRLDSHDREITEAWVECALESGDLEMAQKALLASLRNASVKNQRRVTFHTCLIMASNFFAQNHLRLSRVTSPTGDKNGEGVAFKPSPKTALFPTLARRMSEKHLPVKNAQECYVAALVHRMDSTAAANKFLVDNAYFVQGSSDLEMLLLETTEQMNDYEKAYEYGITSLEHSDSVESWKLLNRAAVASHHSVSPVQALRETPSTVNQMIAELDWAKRSNNGEASQSALLVCWNKLSTKPGCFLLLKDYITDKNIHMLPHSHSSEVPTLINLAKSRRSVGLADFDETTAQKIVENYKDITDYELDNKNSVSLWLVSYNAHIEESPEEKRDYFFNSDALLMGATEISRQAPGQQASQSQDDDYTRERSISLSEYALAEDPFNFNVKSSLVQLYKSSGLHKRAQDMFRSLRTKNIQLEGMTHLMYTRLATLAPDQDTFITSVLDCLATNEISFGGYCVASSTSSAYTQFYSMFESGKVKKFSMANTQYQLEKFGLNRFKATRVQLDALQSIKTDRSLEDRDFKAGFDDGLGPIGMSQLPSISIGPHPDKNYIHAFQARELFLTKKIRTPFTLEKLPESCTDIEKWNLEVVAAISAADATLPPLPLAPRGRDWRFIHWCLSVIETIKIAQSMNSNVSNINGLCESVKTEVLKQKEGSSNYVRNGIEDLKNRNLPGDVHELITSINGDYITALQGIEEKLSSIKI